jgi:RNase adapter protein RapZ
MSRSPQSRDKLSANARKSTGKRKPDLKQAPDTKLPGPRKPDPKKPGSKKQEVKETKKPAPKELVIVTGTSGSGKASALKAFEDLGFYAVDNLPLELLPDFAGLVKSSPEMHRAIIVVDVREGSTLDRLPTILLKVKKTLHTTVIFLDASDAVLVRRFSETRRPHPLSRSEMVAHSITSERQILDVVRNLADFIIDTSGFNVHELRAYVQARFGPGNSGKSGDGGQHSQLLVSCLSFGFKNGVPLDADLVFDVRFLPNPHFVPEFRKLTGKHPKVAKYVRDFPQTTEFLTRVTQMMLFLLPYYEKEGKSYLTIAFGCTGGQHRSVMMAEEMARRLGKAGFRIKAVHRDIPR